MTDEDFDRITDECRASRLRDVERVFTHAEKFVERVLDQGWDHRCLGRTFSGSTKCDPEWDERDRADREIG